MQLIDTHSHLYLPQFEEDISDVISRCEAQGIDQIYLPNIDSATISDVFQLCDAYPKLCFPMLGLHPCSVKENHESELSLIKERLKERRLYAIGEIGLDYYWDLSFKEAQQDAFRQQIGWAKEMNLPIVIHSRDSMDDVLEILEKEKDERLFGICHCFTGNIDQAKKAISLGFKLGIGGVVTFKNGGMDKTLPEIDLAHLVLETDAPYLAPVPFRGKRNESSYLTYIAEKIAQIKGCSVDMVAEQTSANAINLFLR